MTKQDIIETLVHEGKLSRSSAIQAVETLIQTLSDAFACGESVYIRGLCTFRVVDTPRRTARNLNTGAKVIIPAGRNVKIKLSKQLKNRMNNGKLD